MDLREYEQSKFAIAEILRSASPCLPEREEELRVRLQDLFARLAEDRFNLVVFGRFNRGKTSLMNAILRTDRLPIGIVPLTSVITTVGYGSKERVVLKYDNRILDHEIPIEALPQHITQQRIKTAEVQLPAEVLRRGFYFVDTPGLGSVILENTFTTEAFLPEADALILVTSYESPLSEDEVRFFKAGASSGRRVFVVLNKHDTVSLEQRKIALAYVREQLGILFGDSIVPILSVSSTDGLNAKLSGDQRLLEASGLPGLEQQLLDFLLTEKSSEFLRLMCHRARQFLKELPNGAEVVDLVARVDALSQQFGRKTQARSTRVSVSADFPNLHQLQSCEICAQVADKLWNFLCKYQYDIIVGHDEQQRFASRGGLCPFHTWQLWPVSSSYGICAGHAPLFERLAAALRESASIQRLTQIHAQLHELLPDEHDCALCNVRDRAEEDAIDTLAKRLEQDKTRALNTLSAICLPHFVMLTSAVRDSALVRTMLKRQATVLERYAEDMKRYAIKHAGVRQHLASEEETRAAERGLLLVAGRSQVNFMPRQSVDAKEAGDDP